MRRLNIDGGKRCNMHFLHIPLHVRMQFPVPDNSISGKPIEMNRTKY